ncbi:TIGR02117 family protein [Cytophaga aurantiaca]|uniref:TIGR02117 family protein n=1 Tax=Cytophaga aurantiaca TaxID=29530 RepID=UPI000374F442|nr:TIGR02117 family protein [Cytophaga aurantiaca]
MNFNFLKLLKRFFKYFLYVLIGLVAYAAIVVSIAYIPVNTDFKSCSEDCVEVYIRSNGVHTDIVLPIKNELKDWSLQLDSKKTKAGKTNFKYVSIGWGDKGFYLDTPTWGDLTFKTAFNALFYLSSSAMHVTFFDQLKEGERCKKILISKTDYMKIVSFVESSFQVNESNAYMQIPNVSYGNNDVFYEAKGRYNLFYTCNTWTNNCLKSGGLKACLWTVLDKGFFYHYQ